MASVAVAFARFESRMAGERMKAAAGAAKRRGARLGRKPAAESSDPEERRRAEVAMRRIANLRAEGLSSRKIAERLNEEGVEGVHGGRWHHRTVLLALERYGVKTGSS